MTYIVFGGEGCSYCKQAVALLESKGLSYDYSDVRQSPPLTEGITYRDVLFQMMTERDLPLPRSIPQIFLDKGDEGVEYIGGFTELKKSLQ